MTSEEPRGVLTRPLRVHLGVVFVGLLLAVTVPVLWLSYQRGSEAAHEAIDMDMKTVSERIVDHYHIAFADKIASIRIAASLEEMATPPPADLEAKRDFLFAVIEQGTEIDGVFVGYPDGRFLRMVSLREGSPWREPLEAPADAAAAVEMVMPDAEGKQTVRWSFLDSDGKPLSFLPAKPTDFDPRTRPWYRAANSPKVAVATEPYVMPFSKAYVKTIAIEHIADRGVVIAIDVLMESIAAFLSAERISPHADAYVFNPAGKLIIHSDPEVMAELHEIADGQRGEDHSQFRDHDPLLADVLAAVAKTGSGQTHFEKDGERYEALFVPVDFLSVLEGYTIAVVAPLSDFTAKVDADLNQGLLISAVILIIGIVITVIVARLISRSLTMLTIEAERLRDFNFEKAPPTNSRISEIIKLGSALDAARIGIRSFSLFVPKELVRRIIGSGMFDRNAASRQTVTALFTDVQDFTTLSERRQPEEVVEMLSDYLDLMTSVVEQNGGTVLQFVGDGIYALWNAPLPDAHHAAHACRCALDMQAALSAFNAARASEGQPELITRIGIHTGPALVGNIGAQDRLQYTAMGDTINVASRLEGLNKAYGTGILASRQTRDACNDAFVFEPHGAAQVKGRDETVEIFEPRPILRDDMTSPIGPKEGSTP